MKARSLMYSLLALAVLRTAISHRLSSLKTLAPNVNGIVECRVGDYVMLTCDTHPVPEAQHRWYLSHAPYHRVYPLTKNETQVITSARVYIDTEGSLHFIYVKSEDTNRYKCAVLNTTLGTETCVSQKILNVESELEFYHGIPQTKARNQFHTHQTTFVRNKKAVLECVFSGYPIPNITWYDKQKNEISQNNRRYEIVDGNHKLIIKDLEENDEGTYTCKGSNNGGHDKSTIFLHVKSSENRPVVSLSLWRFAAVSAGVTCAIVCVIGVAKTMLPRMNCTNCSKRL